MLVDTQKYDILNDYHKGETIRKIAKTRQISRNTVKKYIREWEKANTEAKQGMTALEISQSMMGKPTYDSSGRRRMVVTAEVEEIIKNCLSENERKRKMGRSKEQQNAVNIHEAILTAGYQISYPSVVKAVRRMEETRNEAYIKQVYNPGDVCEFDWGEVSLTIGGKTVRYTVAVFTLAASNTRYALLYHRQNTASFMNSHAAAFEYFGGIPLQMVYDNMRVAIAEFAGKNKTGNEYDEKPDKVATIALKQMAAYYGFSYRFCNIRSGNEKGHVERSVDVVRNRAFSDKDIFETEEEAAEKLSAAIDKLNADKLAVDTIVRNSAFTLADERGAMLEAKQGLYWSEQYTRKVDKFSTISINANHYSVPDHLVGKRVFVTEFANSISVFYNGREVASHTLASGKHEYTLNIHHFLETLKRKPGALKNSLCLSQAEDELRTMYARFFKDSASEFALMLHTLNGYQLSELRAACELLTDNGAKVTADGIKMLLLNVSSAEYTSAAEEIEIACIAQLRLQSSALTGRKSNRANKRLSA